jgi:hypothetical protein
LRPPLARPRRAQPGDPHNSRHPAAPWAGLPPSLVPSVVPSRRGRTRRDTGTPVGGQFCPATHPPSPLTAWVAPPPPPSPPVRRGRARVGQQACAPGPPYHLAGRGVPGLGDSQVNWEMSWPWGTPPQPGPTGTARRGQCLPLSCRMNVHHSCPADPRAWGRRMCSWPVLQAREPAPAQLFGPSLLRRKRPRCRRARCMAPSDWPAAVTWSRSAGPVAGGGYTGSPVSCPASPPRAGSRGPPFALCCWWEGGMPLRLLYSTLARVQVSRTSGYPTWGVGDSSITKVCAVLTPTNLLFKGEAGKVYSSFIFKLFLFTELCW